ncbi:hypothetical protein HOP61_17920 [Halomonas daqingensis]|uniref:Uncharacterized protein n=1 Tax=Billgrantia desiderata TaxID=52021 RepID=A0AAW4YXV6_9GAMM|nr:hypothetical protein [Halomonas desiderata]MCE8053172.1 hypothetical protein [Halomonas desiderata]
MRHDEMTELAEDLEELRDCLIDATEGEAMPADAAMRGHAALDALLAHLENLAND